MTLETDIRAALDVLGPLQLRAVRAAWRGSPETFWTAFERWRAVVDGETAGTIAWRHPQGTWIVSLEDAEVVFLHLAREDVEHRRFDSAEQILPAIQRRANAVALELGEAPPFEVARPGSLTRDDAVGQLRDARAALAKKRALAAPKGFSGFPGLPLDGDKVTKPELMHLLRRDYDKGEIRVGPALAALGDEEARDELGAFLMKQGLSKPGARWAAKAAAELGGPRTSRVVMDYLDEHARSSKGHVRCVVALGFAERLALKGEPLASLAVYALAATRTAYRPRRLEAYRALADVAAAWGRTPGQHLLRCFGAAAADLDEEVRLRWLAARCFEDFMRSGARFDEAELEERLDESPLLAGLAQLVVWGVFDAGDGVVGVGRLEGGELVDSQEQRLDVDLDERLGVLHPAEVDEETAMLWRQRMAAAQLEAPFSQLDRGVHRLEGKEAREVRLHRFAGVRREEVEDALIDAGFWRDAMWDLYTTALPRDDHVVCALFDLNGLLAEVRSGGDGTGCPELPFGQLHPVSVSEVLRALTRTTPRVVMSGVLPQRGKYPYAERARSGRSKCIGCGEKIEKGAVRVAVERELDDVAYRGRAPAYCHVDCMGRIPELRTVPDLEAALTRNSGGVWPV
jgi:hypothetical protein